MVLLLAMMIVMAILEMIGVVSIMPFMAVLTNTEMIETNILLKTAFQNSNKLGIENKEQFCFYWVSLFFNSCCFTSIQIPNNLCTTTIYRRTKLHSSQTFC